MMAPCKEVWNQSLRRLGVDYVDIFYHHRFDPHTPLEESLGALHTAVTSGRALYVGISSYSDKRTSQAVAILRQLDSNHSPLTGDAADHEVRRGALRQR